MGKERGGDIIIRDITIGQYYPAKSVLHSLDPRVKLAGTFLYIISLFIFESLSGYVLAGLILLLTIKASHVPFSYIVKGLKSVVFVMMFAVFFNVFFSHGQHQLVKYGVISITVEGIELACFMAIRLVYLILGSSLMTFTTTPNQLTDGLEKALAPLNRLKIPVHEIAMMMSIALRFIPILLEEADKIMKAQSARGADFETGNLMTRAKRLVPLLVPLFISAFRRANDLAMAMEARCYRGGEGRTKMKPLKYKRLDYVGYSLVASYLGIVFVIENYII